MDNHKKLSRPQSSDVKVWPLTDGDIAHDLVHDLAVFMPSAEVMNRALVRVQKYLDDTTHLKERAATVEYVCEIFARLKKHCVEETDDLFEYAVIFDEILSAVPSGYGIWWLGASYAEADGDDNKMLKFIVDAIANLTTSVANRDLASAKMLADIVDRVLDDQGDLFGTEGQNDPRGDRR